MIISIFLYCFFVIISSFHDAVQFFSPRKTHILTHFFSKKRFLVKNRYINMNIRLLHHTTTLKIPPLAKLISSIQKMI